MKFKDTIASTVGFFRCCPSSLVEEFSDNDVVIEGVQSKCKHCGVVVELNSDSRWVESKTQATKGTIQ